MKRERPRSTGGALGLVLLANALPIGAVAAALVLRAEGKLAIRPLPAESVGPLALIAIIIVAVGTLGWIAFPALRELRAVARRRIGGPLSFVWQLLAFFLLLDLAAIAAIVLALVGGELFLIARFALTLRG